MDEGHAHDGADGEPLCDSARRAWEMVGEHDGRIAQLAAAMQAFSQALQGPWAGYPGRTHTERYYTVPAEAVEAFRRALEPGD